MRSKREMFCQAYCAIKNKEPNQKQNKHTPSRRNSCVNKNEKRNRDGSRIHHEGALDLAGGARGQRILYICTYTHSFITYMGMKTSKRIQLFPLVTQQQKNNTAGKNARPWKYATEIAHGM